jgi:hypothetical protein
MTFSRRLWHLSSEQLASKQWKTANLTVSTGNLVKFAQRPSEDQQPITHQGQKLPPMRGYKEVFSATGNHKMTNFNNWCFRTQNGLKPRKSTFSPSSTSRVSSATYSRRRQNLRSRKIGRKWVSLPRVRKFHPPERFLEICWSTLTRISGSSEDHKHSFCFSFQRLNVGPRPFRPRAGHFLFLFLWWCGTLLRGPNEFPKEGLMKLYDLLN